MAGFIGWIVGSILGFIAGFVLGKWGKQIWAKVVKKQTTPTA